MKGKKLVRKVAMSYYFTKVSVLSGLMEDSWTVVSSFSVSLVWYLVFLEEYEENQVLHRQLGKGRP